jgi:hypothetical protein
MTPLGNPKRAEIKSKPHTQQNLRCGPPVRPQQNQDNRNENEHQGRGHDPPSTTGRNTLTLTLDPLKGANTRFNAPTGLGLASTPAGGATSRPISDHLARFRAWHDGPREGQTNAQQQAPDPSGALRA